MLKINMFEESNKNLSKQKKNFCRSHIYAKILCCATDVTHKQNWIGQKNYFTFSLIPASNILSATVS